MRVFGGIPGIDNRTLFQLLSPGGRGRRGGRGGFGGRQQAPLVSAGDYWVHVTVNGETFRRKLKVETH